VRTWYEKVWFHTETKTGYPLEGIPTHLCELLTNQQWGYWRVQGEEQEEEANDDPLIQVDALFDFGGHSYQVIDVDDELVRALRFGARNIIPVVFHNRNEVRKQNSLHNAFFKRSCISLIDPVVGKFRRERSLARETM
jgi:hypothetical protein